MFNYVKKFIIKSSFTYKLGKGEFKLNILNTIKIKCFAYQKNIPGKMLYTFDLNNLPEGRKFISICYTALEKKAHSNNYEIYR